MIGLMLVSGRVTKIIPPRDHGKYFYGFNGAHTARGKYFVNIVDVEIPKPFLERLRFWWKHRKDKRTWVWMLVMSECQYCEGDVVNVDVEPFLPAVELWTPKPN